MAYPTNSYTPVDPFKPSVSFSVQNIVRRNETAAVHDDIYARPPAHDSIYARPTYSRVAENQIQTPSQYYMGRAPGPSFHYAPAAHRPAPTHPSRRPSIPQIPVTRHNDGDEATDHTSQIFPYAPAPRRRSPTSHTPTNNSNGDEATDDEATDDETTDGDELYSIHSEAERIEGSRVAESNEDNYGIDIPVIPLGPDQTSQSEPLESCAMSADDSTDNNSSRPPVSLPTAQSMPRPHTRFSSRPLTPITRHRRTNVLMHKVQQDAWSTWEKVTERHVYLHLLLRLPYLYFSRVTRVFEDAEINMPKIKEGILAAAMSIEKPYVTQWNWQFEPPKDNVPFKNLQDTWQSFIDSLLREWKTLNIISVLLLSAILTILQIEDAATDPLTRYAALTSLICALMSLLYGCVYIIRFGTMRKTYKAAEWANEAKQTRQSIFWNVWVLLAMPAVWLAWAMILFVVCIMSFVWRTGTTEDGAKAPLTRVEVLGARIVVTLVLTLGLLYFALITATLRKYGEMMDRAWRQRIVGWVNDTVKETHFNPYYPSADSHWKSNIVSPRPPPPHTSSPAEKSINNVTGVREEKSHNQARVAPASSALYALDASTPLAKDHPLAMSLKHNTSIHIEGPPETIRVEKRGAPNLPSDPNQTLPDTVTGEAPTVTAALPTSPKDSDSTEGLPSSHNLHPRPRDWRLDYTAGRGGFMGLVQHVLPQVTSSDWRDDKKREVHSQLLFKPRSPLIEYDLREPDRLGIDSNPLESKVDMTQLAFNPPAQFMRLFHPQLPWYIDIATRNTVGITVGDLFDALRTNLMRPILAQDFWTHALSESDRSEISAAFYKRCQNRPEIIKQGVMSVDYLRDNCLLQGFTRRSNGIWEIRTRRRIDT